MARFWLLSSDRGAKTFDLPRDVAGGLVDRVEVGGGSVWLILRKAEVRGGETSCGLGRCEDQGSLEGSRCVIEPLIEGCSDSDAMEEFDDSGDGWVVA